MQINVLEYLENGAARQCPDKTAIVDGARSYTFAELERYAKRCATLLIRRFDVTCRPVAVFLPKSASVIFADLGIDEMDLGMLAGDLDLFPDEALAIIARKLGFGHALERALDAAIGR